MATKSSLALTHATCSVDQQLGFNYLAAFAEKARLDQGVLVYTFIPRENAASGQNPEVSKTAQLAAAQPLQHQSPNLPKLESKRFAAAPAERPKQEPANPITLDPFLRHMMQQLMKKNCVIVTHRGGEILRVRSNACTEFEQRNLRNDLGNLSRRIIFVDCAKADSELTQHFAQQMTKAGGTALIGANERLLACLKGYDARYSFRFGLENGKLTCLPESSPQKPVSNSGNMVTDIVKWLKEGDFIDIHSKTIRLFWHICAQSSPDLPVEKRLQKMRVITIVVKEDEQLADCRLPYDVNLHFFRQDIRCSCDALREQFDKAPHTYTFKQSGYGLTPL